MNVDEALEMAETWQALPDANGAAHVLAVEVRKLREQLLTVRALADRANLDGADVPVRHLFQALEEQS